MIRKATLRDVNKIYQLIKFWADKGVMLERSRNYIFENIRDYWVYETRREIAGVCALHIVGWDDLGEVKSLAVAEPFHGKGVGKKLIHACVEEAKTLGVKKLFALTFIPSFFRKLKFRNISMKLLPHKIWSECVNCVDFPDCKEQALLLTITKQK